MSAQRHQSGRLAFVRRNLRKLAGANATRLDAQSPREKLGRRERNLDQSLPGPQIEGFELPGELRPVGSPGVVLLNRGPVLPRPGRTIDGAYTIF